MIKIRIATCPQTIEGSDVPRSFREALVGLPPVDAIVVSETPDRFAVNVRDIEYQLALARRAHAFRYWRGQEAAGRQIITIPADCCEIVAEQPSLVQ